MHKHLPYLRKSQGHQPPDTGDDATATKLPRGEDRTDFRCPADWSPELLVFPSDRKAEAAQEKIKHQKKDAIQAKWWPGAASLQHLPAVGLLALPRAQAAHTAQPGGSGEILGSGEC